MSDAFSFAEIDEQHVEVLPPRTVMSMFGQSEIGGGNTQGGLGINLISGIGVLGTGTALAGDAISG
ncbi:MAG: hypothetical protein ACRDQU_05635 [Pseudonocardiaceae bacterium]